MRTLPTLTLLLLVAACGDSNGDTATDPFTLRFAAVVDGRSVGCSDRLTGFPAGSTIGMNDLRFYVSRLRLLDADGEELPLELDENEFQYGSPEGDVALIDLTGNTEGSCASSSVAAAEGTARTHDRITGKTRAGEVAAVAFDVGVPQAVMKKVIADRTPEGAPSPLGEMYWSWASGYRHLVLNFAVEDSGGEKGAGYVHVGSRDCGPQEGKALEDRERCTFVNTPAVSLAGFDLERDLVGLDLRALLSGVDFRSPIYDPETFEVIGEGPGVECHSSPMQPDCALLFAPLGLDMTTGAADAAETAAFVRVEG